MVMTFPSNKSHRPPSARLLTSAGTGLNCHALSTSMRPKDADNVWQHLEPGDRAFFLAKAQTKFWVAVKELDVHYHSRDT